MNNYPLRQILLLAFLIFNSFCFSQNSKIDSLLSLIKKDKEDTNKIDHLNALGAQLMYSNSDTCILISNRALQLAEKLSHSPDASIAIAGKKGVAKSLGQLGSYNYFKADFPKALDYYFRALKMTEELGNKNYIAIILNNIGNVYRSQADYPKALEYSLKALKIKEELGNKKGIAINLSNIGNIYNAQADHSKALDYYFKALKMAEDFGDKNLISINLGNIGTVYNDKGDNPNALAYYFKALKINEELGNKYLIAANIGNIGNVYMKQAESYLKANAKEELFDKALDYYCKALKLKEELGDQNGIALYLGNIGKLYTKTGKFAAAENYLKHSLALYDSIGSLDGTMDFEKSLSHLYDTTGRVKLAFQHYKKYIAARDSINSEENQKNQARTEINHEFEKKEALAKAEQDKKDLIAEEEKQKQKLFLWFTICGLAVVIVVSIFIFRSLQINKKKNKIISEQKKIVEHQKKVVEEKQKEILDSIHYAKRIQTALLTTEKYINRNLNKLK